jgi:flagellar hook-basal body complex protein FliE
MNGITSLSRPFEPIRIPADPASSSADKSAFADALRQAVEQVSQLEAQSGDEIRKLLTGESEDLHKTMLAVERAELAAALLLEMRNKVVAAYQEIMRIQV